ncbi:probable carboxylesterase 2 [Phragmites australis]|uniref:probable carboxylesterase 2 n=1 Tax=Phragmites australis TaxID=29695 RepID=UPI002D794FB8|nr:probable carboxylesterase 2 [Phragmites australis]
MAMHGNKSAPAVTKKAEAEIANDMRPFLIRFKDGRIKRLATSTFVPASEAPGATGVATRDVVIDPGTGVSARLFLCVGAVTTGTRLPLVVYFHGGAFCTGSAFSELFHSYAASLSARARALVVSVDYRLAPEHPIPAAYDDAWAALRWVASLSDPWIAYHADHKRMFLAGESAGANIAHNLAVRAAFPDGNNIDIDVEGIVLLQPFFWGPERLPSETNRHDGPIFVPEFVDTLWPFLTAGAAGNDDPRINPRADQVASLRCRRALVAVAAKDVSRDRGCRYAAWLRHGEWCREVTLVVSEGEDHGFHLYRPARASAVALMDHVVELINGRAPLPITNAETELPHEHPAATMHLLARDGTNELAVGRAKSLATSVALEPGRVSSTNVVQQGPFPAAALGRFVARSCL